MQKNRVQVIFINLGEEGTSLFVGEAGSKYRYDLPKEDVFKQSQSRYTAETDIEKAAYESVMQKAYRLLNEYKVARNHKDLLLRAIFRNKEEMLSLYNGLNGSSYTDASALEITTLENAV